jgi:predicted glycosyltransferase involved in capsule biosynthesis
MENLLNTTFIIPVCVESQDRFNNAKTVLGYLNHHFKTNVSIHEITQGESKLTFLNELKNLNIKHKIEQSNLTEYHRTRQLNEMLDNVTTKVVVNYDIDVILPVTTYIQASNDIINNKCNVIYPYGEGLFQKRIFTSFNRENFNLNFNLSDINKSDYDIWTAKYGHCIFFNTKKYRNAGGENENFIAYGPEDVERYERFNKIGCNICRINDFIYHLEHSRTEFSNNLHKHYDNNNNLFDELNKLNSQQTIEYYKNVDYIKKYKNFKA